MKYFENELSFKQDMVRHDEEIAKIEDFLSRADPEGLYYKAVSGMLQILKDSRVDLVDKIGRNRRKKK